MTESALLTLAISLVGVVFGLLMLVIGWMGNKLYNKVDEIAQSLLSMSAELHDRVTGIDKRLTTVEAVQTMCHGNPNRRNTD